MTTAPTASSLLGIEAQPTCRFCGRELETAEITVLGRSYAGLPCFGSCGCEESRAYLEGESADEAAQRRYRAAGIGEAYLAAELEDGKLLGHVLGGDGLFVTGPIGSGKTYLASAVAKGAVDKGRTVRFETAVGILRELRDSFNGAPTEALERAFACDVLVLDDLGKESPTPFALSVVFELVDERYRNGRPIVVTTNFQGDELVRRLGAGDAATAVAIVSRLHESCVPVRMPDEDRRLA